MTYRPPHADNLESFKTLMRVYCCDTPSEEVLASLDDSPFGAWIRDHFILGEGHEDVPSFSEDLQFCRKARKAGYQIWCDVEVTGAIEHLGEIAVGTKNEDGRIRLPLPPGAQPSP